LAMETVANSLFNAPIEFGDMLARTRLLWTDYEQRLTRAKPRLPLRDLLREASGLDLDDLLVLTFGVFAHANTAAAGAAQPLDLASTQLPKATIDTYLARFSATAADLAAALAGAGDSSDQAVGADASAARFDVATPAIAKARYHSATRIIGRKITAARPPRTASQPV
jgi:hypothetical protein